MKKNFKAGIYEIINKINDKKYIGSSIDLENRRRAHFSELTRKIHGNAALQNSYNKHGFENFKFNILFYCNKKDLLFYEQRAIDVYGIKNIYNIQPLAKNSLGTKRSALTRKKISIIQKNRSQEIIEKIRKSVSGKNNANFGKEKSKEFKEKVSKALSKPINVFEYKTNKFIMKCNSIKECAEILKISRKHISGCALGKRRSCGGYVFKYINEKDKLRCKNYKIPERNTIIKAYKFSNNEYIGTYESESECARQLGIQQTCISRVIRGLQEKTNIYFFIKGTEYEFYKNS